MSKPGYYIKIYTSSYIKTDIRKSTRPYTWESARTWQTFRTNNIQGNQLGLIPGNLTGFEPTFIPIILQWHLLQDMHKSHEYKSTSTGSDKMKCSEKVVNFNIPEKQY